MTEIPVAQDQEALCSVEEAEKLMEDEPSEAMRTMLAAGILLASDEARSLGVESWTFATAPPAVSRIVAAAAARWVANPEGYLTSRAGDETLGWVDIGEEAGTIRFTKREERRLKNFRVKLGGFGSFEITAWNSRAPGLNTIYAEVPDGRRPFPLWADE